MAHEYEFVYVNRVEQRARVVGQRLEAELVGSGLGRLSETDLVRRYNAVSLGSQCANSGGPVGARKVFAVQEDNRSPVRLRGCDIHIGHAQFLLLRFELV